MKFNLDKDALKKHHYWVVAGGALLLSLVALFMLRTGVRANINAEKKKLEGSFTEIESASGKEVKSKASIEAKRKEAEDFKAQEVVVWKNASQKQADLIRFAPDVEAKYKFNRDPLTDEIGFFLTSVDVHGEAMELDAQPLEGNTFKGTILTTSEYKITAKGPVKYKEPAKVKGEEPTEKTQEMTYTLYNTPTVKLKREGLDGQEVFGGLRIGDKITAKFERGRYFNDLLTQQERTDFSNSYRDQYIGILKQVDPITTEETGVVQLGMGNRDFWPFPGKPPETPMKFIHIIDKAELVPTQDFSELAWIAQENVWIQRELYRLVDQANGYVRNFEEVVSKDKKKDVWIGKNAYWQAELKLDAAKEPATLAVTLRNLLARRQGLGVTLLVWFKNAKEPERVPVSGASARDAKSDKGDSKGNSFSTTVALADGVERGPIERVEQLLSWDLAAVKRIDEIGLGADAEVTPHSHRTFPIALKPFKEEKKAVAAEVEVGGMPPMGMPPGVLPPAGGGPGGLGGGKIIPGGKNRYIEVSQQARRVPVVVSLIVDQQHVDRVQTSFANSKLRFLTTQVLMNRYPYSLNPNLNKKADTGGIGVPPSVGPMGPGPMGPRLPMEGAGSGSPMGGTPGAGFPMEGGPGGFGDDFGGGTRSNDELEANVELVIYGVVTLYERYPPKQENPVAAE